ncbi:hypothetical protein E3N88_37978 [Mikania micrantha]|uniref:Phospholipase D n=1 Tax=Mikania micrantha TaxID=192012 RepID=A0A5N6LSQ2_9ASTR|nr:hypothetical protein E3N88_37978 [Mikania micrantha]
MIDTCLDSDSIIYLHGDLDLTIAEARCLPNMDLLSDRMHRCFTIFDFCKSLERRKSQHRRKIITSDPYVTVSVGGATVARTRVISNSQNPIWNEHFVTPLAHPASTLEFQVKDNDLFGADLIGVVTISAERVMSGELIDDWFPIIGPSGKAPKPNAAIRLRIKFASCDDRNKRDAIDPDGLFGLKDSYFPVRNGGNVTLYQDAHVREGQLPEIELDGEGKVFKQRGCWEDICHAILEAHHLVYIIGWSIYDKVKLVREPTKPLRSGWELTLGELLKYKSQEGVRVLLLVWDDKTSHNKMELCKLMMKRHGSFSNTLLSTVCFHLDMQAINLASSNKRHASYDVVGTLYTHHQKCVIVDTQAHGNNRKISAFIGGLDLCDGRYDTPEHRLFRDLGTVFENDYHNPTFTAGTKGPRQPWHDLHCKIDGPAAYDVLKNFEQRWRKATKWSEFGRRFKRISHWHDDSLIKLERISWILSPTSTIPNDDPALWVSREADPENWHVQVFRSIDSGSLKGFPNDVRSAESQKLMCAKNLVIDNSIQKAYIQAIRSAKNFIYIENQYFLGSSYAWNSYKDAGADHLIPMELALKIARKIRANERFSVYVVIPMWPEGVPSSASVQEILFWQGQTMQMMYEVIARELKNSKLENAHPQDYLNFYCLGNREQCDKQVSDSGSHTSSNGGSVSASQKHGRFMIYVHAKGMIVDDEMSLWAEHTGKVEDYFKQAESLTCVENINKLAEDNWQKFTDDDYTPLQGHLLKYPIKVDSDGKVTCLPGHEHFPDVGGKVLGNPSTLPSALTT